jgi:hypothetical protein
MNDIGLKLQNELRKVDNTISLYELAKRLGVQTDEILRYIQDNVLPCYNEIYKKNAFKMPYYTEEEIKEFFTKDIVDIGFLCMHKIEEVNASLIEKIDTFAHKIFYNNWIIYRGY